MTPALLLTITLSFLLIAACAGNQAAPATTETVLEPTGVAGAPPAATQAVPEQTASLIPKPTPLDEPVATKTTQPTATLLSSQTAMPTATPLPTQTTTPVPVGTPAPCPTGTSEDAWVSGKFWASASLDQVQFELRCGGDVKAKNEGGDDVPAPCGRT